MRMRYRFALAPLPARAVILCLAMVVSAAIDSHAQTAALSGPRNLGTLALDSALSTVSPDEFVARNSRFEFTSAARESARVEARRLPEQEAPVFEGFPLVDAVMRFDKTGNELTLVVYSVGDSGVISEEKFDGMVESLVVALTKAYGKGVSPGVASAVVRAKALSWKCPAGQIRLEWSSTRANASRGQAYRPEFARVVIGPALVRSLSTPRPAKWIPAEQLRSSDTGDRWIATVPMVDQGQKGYCAVATSERVLRYYGRDVDQHELAQACQTEQGTNSQKFEEQMKRVASRLGLRYQIHLSAVDPRFIGEIIRDYAKAGKRKGGVPVPSQLEQHPYAFYQMLDSLDRGQLVAVRKADRAGLARMERQVRESIDRADPLIWCVQLGIVPEQGLPQANGGHMRLIIGYNAKTSEVLYTDSWGAGHELKRMPLSDAWAITFGLSVMKP